MTKKESDVSIPTHKVTRDYSPVLRLQAQIRDINLGTLMTIEILGYPTKASYLDVHRPGNKLYLVPLLANESSLT